MIREKGIAESCCFLSVTHFFVVIFFTLSLLLFLQPISCQNDQNYGSSAAADPNGNPARKQIFSQLVVNSFSNITSVFKKDISKYFGFCVMDVCVYVHIVVYLLFCMNIFGTDGAYK